MSKTVRILLLFVYRLFPRCEPSSVKGERHNLYCTLIRLDQSKFGIEFLIAQKAHTFSPYPSGQGAPYIKGFSQRLSRKKVATLIVASHRVYARISLCIWAVPPQAASLVRGDTPRNAPLQNHASPTLRLQRSRASPAASRLPTEYANRSPAWRRGRKAGQNRQCMWLSSSACSYEPILPLYQHSPGISTMKPICFLHFMREHLNRLVVVLAAFQRSLKMQFGATEKHEIPFQDHSKTTR